MISPPSRILAALAILAVSAVLLPRMSAEDCQTSTDMGDATRAAITSAGQRYFAMVAKGDVASLKQDSIPSVAESFSGIAATIKDNQPKLAGTQAVARPPFLLDAPGTAPIAHAEFFCGIFGKTGQTANSAAFYLNNLPRESMRWCCWMTPRPNRRRQFLLSCNKSATTGRWAAFI